MRSAVKISVALIRSIFNRATVSSRPGLPPSSVTARARRKFCERYQARDRTTSQFGQRWDEAFLELGAVQVALIVHQARIIRRVARSPGTRDRVCAMPARQIPPGSGESLNLGVETGGDPGQLIRPNQAGHFLQVDAVHQDGGIAAVADSRAAGGDDQLAALDRRMGIKAVDDSRNFAGAMGSG